MARGRTVEARTIDCKSPSSESRGESGLTVVRLGIRPDGVLLESRARWWADSRTGRWSCDACATDRKSR